ncbi:MAG: cbb3-type cytochrome c oxidase subunit I [Verrucomicrobiales bacterium]|nr:cbb3-type cytochrome c oxidase subunit I [Verrucomicrobiales bacterium]
MSSRPRHSAEKRVAVEPLDAAALERLALLDRVARWPVLTLVVSGLFWAVIAGGLQVIAAIKLHAPGFLADTAWLTYGRVAPAAANLFVLGFGIPMGLGVAAWLTSRLGSVPLAWRGMMLVGVKAWSLGLLVGVVGILGGRGTGIEGLELPAFALPIMLPGYLLMAAPVLRTFAQREPGEVYVSQWYVLAAVVTFPWFQLAGTLVAVWFPLRGVLPAMAGAWFLHGVFVLWFLALALAVVFYFVPKLVGRPLPSRNVALFGFWMLIIAGPIGGPARFIGGPFPAWLPSLGVVGNVWLLVPLVAVAVNLLLVLRGQRTLVKSSNALGFTVFSLAACLLWFGLNIVNSLGFFRHHTQFTLFTPGLDWLLLWGGFGTAMLGAVYYLVPRLMGAEWMRPAWVRMHLGLVAGAVVVLVGAHLLGGWLHGSALRDPTVPFVDVARRYIPFAATGTLAWLLLLGANLLLTVQIGWLLWTTHGASCVPEVRSWLRPETREVNP